MKNILTVIRNPLGGIRTYIKYTYGALPRGKYHFTIVIVKAGEKDSTFIKSDLESRGVSFNLLEVTDKNANKSLMLYIYKLLKEQSFDLIHSHGFTSGFLTVCANAIIKTPHIITSHDVFREDQFMGLKGKIKRSLIGFVLSRATIVQSVGEDAQTNFIEYLNTFKSKPGKLTIIKNGIEVDGFAEKRQIPKGAIRNEVNIQNNQFLFGFLGRFMPQKGFEYLIDAVETLSRDKKLKNKFKILAVNDGDYIREYKKLINDKNLNDYFIFYGFVPDVGLIINDLDAVLMPSRWEAYSLQPAEAFIMGCPVIAANSIGLREVVQDSPALMVKPADKESLAETIIYFMDNKDIVIKNTLKFIPIAEERYSIKHTANKLDLLFKIVMNEDTHLA